MALTYKEESWAAGQRHYYYPPVYTVSGILPSSAMFTNQGHLSWPDQKAYILRYQYFPVLRPNLLPGEFHFKSDIYAATHIFMSALPRILYL